MEKKTTEYTILCECGHSLSNHAMSEGECYTLTRRRERRKDTTGKYIEVKCCYVCYCNRFNLLSKIERKER